MSEMYIRSQDKERLYSFGNSYGLLKYRKKIVFGCRREEGEETVERHTICILNTAFPHEEKYLEKIGEYESRERCLEVIDEIQEKCESYLYAPGNPGLLRGSTAFPPMAEIIPRVYQMPEK